MMVYCAIAVPACAQTGAGVNVVPGEWQIQASSSTPALSQKTMNTVTRCIRTGKIDPAKILGGSHSCEVTERKDGDNSMRWNMTCDIPGIGKTRGKGEFVSVGESAHGSAVINLRSGNRTVEMHSEWTGRRVGACRSGSDSD